jgi:hypothetical protein
MMSLRRSIQNHPHALERLWQVAEWALHRLSPFVARVGYERAARVILPFEDLGKKAIFDERGDRKLLYLPLNRPRVSIRPLEPAIRPRRGAPVEILILAGYLCPFETAAQMAVLDVAREFGERVVLRQEALSPETLRRYGVAYGVFINGRSKLNGAPTEEAIRQAIAEEL